MREIRTLRSTWRGLETAGPGCDDAVAIAWAAGFRMPVMSRIRHATPAKHPMVSIVPLPRIAYRCGRPGSWLKQTTYPR